MGELADARVQCSGMPAKGLAHPEIPFEPGKQREWTQKARLRQLGMGGLGQPENSGASYQGHLGLSLHCWVPPLVEGSDGSVQCSGPHRGRHRGLRLSMPYACSSGERTLQNMWAGRVCRCPPQGLASSREASSDHPDSTQPSLEDMAQTYHSDKCP